MLRQYGHQFAIFQMRLHAGARYLRQAEAAQARRFIGIGAVDRDTAGHRHPSHFATLLIHKPFRTRAQYADVMHQSMLRQILDGLRHAVTLQVSRAGAIDHREVAKMPGDHRLIRLRADAQYAVETFAQQIDTAIGAADFHLQIRVAIHEFRQARHDQASREDVRHIDADAPGQRSLVLTEQPFDFIHVREQVLAAFIQHQSILSGLHLARGALQQPRAEQGFECLHLFGHCGARQAEAFPGESETRQFADPDEGAQQFQFVHDKPR